MRPGKSSRASAFIFVLYARSGKALAVGVESCRRVAMRPDSKLRHYADGVRKALWKEHRITKTTDQLLSGWLVRIRIIEFMRRRLSFSKAAGELVAK